MRDFVSRAGTTASRASATVSRAYANDTIISAMNTDWWTAYLIIMSGIIVGIGLYFMR
jgi:hypothetical protein